MKLVLHINPYKALIAVTALTFAVLLYAVFHTPSSTALSQDILLKEKATQIFQKERGSQLPDHSYLVALSMALKFQDYERVSQLVRQYETKQGL